MAKKLDLISLKIGCDILIKLSKADSYFSTAVLVLDNDVATKQTNRKIIENKNNICVLPPSNQITENSGGTSRTPEGLIYDFLADRLENCQNYKDFWRSMGSYTTDFVENNIINLSESQRKNRDEMKQWFNKNKKIFDETNILDQWCQDNKRQVDDFIQGLKDAVDFAHQNLEMAKLKN